MGEFIQLSYRTDHEPGFCSVIMTAPGLPGTPEIIFNMESVFTDQSFPVFCRVRSVEAEKSGDELVLLVHGYWERRKGGIDYPPPGTELPYVLRLAFKAETDRVSIQGRFLNRPPGITVRSFGPCFQCRRCSTENDPPFEMARQSFVFLEGKGLTWISDADRTRSESHADDDDGGAWSQHFAVYGADTEWLKKPDRFSKDVKALPFVGWVPRDCSHLIGVSGNRAYDTATRWYPCLHNDMLADDSGGFHADVYMMPMDIELLLARLRNAMPHFGQDLFVPDDALWPLRAGSPVDSMEADSINEWEVTGGSLSEYRSEAKWINGNCEHRVYPEGVTEGEGSMLWEVPEGGEPAAVKKTFELLNAVSASHMAIDAMNRSDGETEIRLEVRMGEVKTARSYPLRYWANRRLLMPLPGVQKARSMDVALTVEKREQPVRLVLDNLRLFS